MKNKSKESEMSCNNNSGSFLKLFVNSSIPFLIHLDRLKIATVPAKQRSKTIESEVHIEIDLRKS